MSSVWELCERMLEMVENRARLVEFLASKRKPDFRVRSSPESGDPHLEEFNLYRAILSRARTPHKPEPKGVSIRVGY